MNGISPLPSGIVTLQSLCLGKARYTASLGSSAHPPWAGGSLRPLGTAWNPLPWSQALLPTLPQLPAGAFNALETKGTRSVSDLEAKF